MTVFGENPGEEYFDMRSVTGSGDVQTHVAYITGMGVSCDDANATGVIGGTTSIVTLAAVNTNAYLVVGGW